MHGKISNGQRRRPSHLFKFMPPERVDFFSEHRLRFTPPAEFNDPFDVAPVASFHGDPTALKGLTEKSHLHLRMRERLQKRADAMFNSPGIPQVLYSRHNGVLSLSERRDSLLMWAHYALNHRGFAIELKAEHHWLARARRVKYSDRRPFIAPLSGHKKPRKPIPDEEANFCFQKSSEWAYEREWRIIRRLEEADVVLPLEPSPIHLFKVPTAAVTGVIIGARMPLENRRSLVNTLLARPRLRIRVVCATLDPRSFALQFTPVPRRDLQSLCMPSEKPFALKLSDDR